MSQPIASGGVMRPIAVINLFRCDEADAARMTLPASCPCYMGIGGAQVGVVRNIRYGGNGFVVGELFSHGLADDPVVIDLPPAFVAK